MTFTLAPHTPLVPIALGAMLMGSRTPEAESRRILDHFVGTVAPRYSGADGTAARAMIDTADCYAWWEVRGEAGGHSERVLGRWLAESGARDRVHLATKGTALLTDLDGVWPSDAGADWDVARTKFVGAGAEVLARSLAGSLARLGVDAIDLYYVHVDDRRVPLVETVGALAGFVADGRIGAYGWSNVPAWRLGLVGATAREHGWPEPVAVQMQHTYLRQRPGSHDQGIVGAEHLDLLAATPGLSLVAYSPVVKAVYSVPQRRTADFWAMGPYLGPDADARFAAVDRVAAATGATGNQVVLAWLRSDRVLPLIGPRTFDQYLEGVESLDLELSPDQRAELDAAGQ